MRTLPTVLLGRDSVLRITPHGIIPCAWWRRSRGAGSGPCTASLSCSFSLSHTHSLSLSHTHTHSLSHSLTHTLETTPCAWWRRSPNAGSSPCTASPRRPPAPPPCPSPDRKVDVRLPGKGNSNSHGARPGASALSFACVSIGHVTSRYPGKTYPVAF